MVEQRSPKPRAEGSSPSAPAKNSATAFAVALFFVIGRNVLATRHSCAPRSACRGGLQPGGLRPGPTEPAGETSPSAPAKKERQASACLSFFVVTGGEASARGARRASPPKRRLWRMQRGGDGAAVGDWQGGPAAADRAGHRKRACEASSSPSLHFHHVMEEPSSLSPLYSILSHPPSSVLIRPHPLQHPKRTRFRLFRPKPGAFRHFCPLLTCKIFGPFFVHLAI